MRASAAGARGRTVPTAGREERPVADHKEGPQQTAYDNSTENAGSESRQEGREMTRTADVLNLCPMTRTKIVFAAALLASSLAGAPAALAGTLQIQDRAHVFSADDANALRRTVDSLPFDAKLMTSNDYPDGAALGSYVGSLV